MIREDVLCEVKRAFTGEMKIIQMAGGSQKKNAFLMPVILDSVR
jgi:hypothetical protein